MALRVYIAGHVAAKVRGSVTPVTLSVRRHKATNSHNRTHNRGNY